VLTKAIDAQRKNNFIENKRSSDNQFLGNYVDLRNQNQNLIFRLHNKEKNK